MGFLFLYLSGFGVCPQNEGAQLQDKASELPGDDGEGDDRAAGFEVQGSEEAFDGCFVFTLSLQDLSKAVPGPVTGGLDPDGVSEDFLGKVSPLKSVQHQALSTKKVASSEQQHTAAEEMQRAELPASCTGAGFAASHNHFGWQRALRSSVNPALPGPH